MPNNSDSLGTKHDKSKPRYDLIPAEVLEEVAEVLAFGAMKYSEDNWKRVENGRQRYMAAALRHVFAALDAEQTNTPQAHADEETNRSHISHAICSLMFALWHIANQNQDQNKGDQS